MTHACLFTNYKTKCSTCKTCIVTIILLKIIVRLLSLTSGSDSLVWTFKLHSKNERKNSSLNLSNSTTSTVQLENQEGIALMIPPRPPAPSAGEPGGAGPRVSTRAVAAGDTAWTFPPLPSAGRPGGAGPRISTVAVVAAGDTAWTFPPPPCAGWPGGVGRRIGTAMRAAIVAIAGAAWWTCPPLPCLGAPGRPFGEGAAPLLTITRSRWEAAAAASTPRGAPGRVMVGAGRWRAATRPDDAYRSSCRGSGLVGADDGDNAMAARRRWWWSAGFRCLARAGGWIRSSGAADRCVGVAGCVCTANARLAAWSLVWRVRLFRLQTLPIQVYCSGTKSSQPMLRVQS